MTRAFSDDSLNRSLEQKGYVVSSLLEPDAVSRLAVSCEVLRSPVTHGFHATVHAKDVEFRRAVFSAITAVMEAPLRQRLPEYRLRMANFVVKEASRADSEVGFHQDWSFVDESRFVSLNVWCPLVDVGPDNGCLHVMAGSHRLSVAPRAHGDAHPFADILAKIRRRHVHAVPMTAGLGVFYDGRLLHGSPPNRTDRRRVSVGCVMVPADATLLHPFGSRHWKWSSSRWTRSSSSVMTRGPVRRVFAVWGGSPPPSSSTRPPC